MKKKKLLSAVLASALMVTALPFQAFAAPVATSSQAKDGNITGDSTVASSALLKFVVPTDFDFIINPLELPVTGGGNGSGSSSQIISTPYAVINKSNMDVQVTVTPTFTSTSGVTIASTPDEIKNVAGEAPTIFLQVAPMMAQPKLTGAGSSLKYDTTDTTVRYASGDGLSVTIGDADTATPVYFKIKNLKNAYSTDGTTMLYDDTKAGSTAPNQTDSIGFKFIGNVSQMSDWTTHAPGVTVYYDFDFITNKTYTDNASVSGTYGMVATDLAVSGPSFRLNKNGEFSMLSTSQGSIASGLFYMVSLSPITVPTQDIIDAIEANPSLTTADNIVVGGIQIKPMAAGTSFTFNQTTKVGELTAGAKGVVTGKHMVGITKIINSDSTSVIIVSPSVLMD